MAVVKQKVEKEEVTVVPDFLKRGLEWGLNYGKEVESDDSVEERLEKGILKHHSKIERKKYANNVVPLNELEDQTAEHFRVDTEKEKLAMEIAKKNGTNRPILVVSNEIENVTAVLEDDEKLKNLNKEAEALERYFDGNHDIEYLTLEERKKKFKNFIEHYTKVEAENSNSGRRKIKTFSEVIKENWNNREGFFSFIGRSFKDFFAYKAVKRGIESYNAGIELKNKYEDEIKNGIEKLETTTDKVKLGLNAKKEAKIHTAGLYLIGLEFIKKFITLPTKKNRSAIVNFVTKYPKDGQKIFKDLGMPLKGLASKARKTEAFARIFDWIFHPEKQQESFIETAGNIALDVAPITGSYRDIKELFNDESEYSFGTRALFAGTSVVMDVIWAAGTFFSAGSAAAPLAAARVTAKAAIKVGAKKMIGSSVMKETLKTIPRMSFKNYVKKMPASARKYLLGKESIFLALFLLGDNAASMFWEKYNPLLKSYAKQSVMEKMSPEQIKLMNFVRRNIS